MRQAVIFLTLALTCQFLPPSNNIQFALTIMDKKVSVWSVHDGGNKVHTADFSGVV